MTWGFHMDDIGGRVKMLRVGKRLSQVELAKRCGISQPSLAYIENGRTKSVRGATLEALARELSTTTTFILEGSRSPDDHEDGMILVELQAIVKSLSQSDKEALLRTARGLAATATKSPTKLVG